MSGTLHQKQLSRKPRSQKENKQSNNGTLRRKADPVSRLPFRDLHHLCTGGLQLFPDSTAKTLRQRYCTERMIMLLCSTETTIEERYAGLLRGKIWISEWCSSHKAYLKQEDTSYDLLLMTFAIHYHIFFEDMYVIGAAMSFHNRQNTDVVHLLVKCCSATSRTRSRW